jgi:hypothetical protein
MSFYWLPKKGLEDFTLSKVAIAGRWSVFPCAVTGNSIENAFRMLRTDLDTSPGRGEE